MTAASLPEAEGDRRGLVSSLLSTSFGVLVVMLGAMWAIEALDTAVLDNRLQGNGIVPRRRSGIDGIAWSPFLHGDWAHIIANSVPLLVLGGLVAFRGLRTFLTATFAIVVLGGALTWFFARSANHIGASGLVFGYFGFLVGAVVFERRLASVVPAAIAIVWFGGSFFLGLVPSEGVSFEGHFFGAVGGFAAARLMLGQSPVDDGASDFTAEEFL